MRELDEFHFDASVAPTTPAMKPLLLKIHEKSIAEYDERDNMLKTLIATVKATAKRKAQVSKGRCLMKWVLDVISEHPLVDWNGED